MTIGTPAVPLTSTSRVDHVFPILTPAQVGRLAAHGRARQVREGEVLIEPGEPTTRLFVVTEGQVEVVRPGAEGEAPAAVFGPGQFRPQTVGAQRLLAHELAHIDQTKDTCSGGVKRPGDTSDPRCPRHSFSHAAQIRAAAAGELIEVDRDALLGLIQTDSELSDILMRAFILRRVELIARGVSDVVVVGSTHCQGTLRLREFLTRNGHPHTMLALDRDTAVQGLPDHIEI